MTIAAAARQLEGCTAYEAGDARSRRVEVTVKESAASVNETGQIRHRDRGLLAIGVFKLLEAVFFFLVGLGVIHFIHRDLGDEAVRVAERLKMDLDGRVMTWVLNHIDDLTAHRLKQIGVATFFYAGLRVAEGVGLVLEKLWAEYLTIGVTVSFLPWEIYEIFRKPDLWRLGLLVTNFGVLVYLAWSLDRRNRRLGRTV
ncbi:MAG TPA: DUF2127 domain-containing protein [Acidobacteriaceae bacterium]|nr:DUF2127 domain-containing protein [Acidobacteriaceae bacterium]